MLIMVVVLLTMSTTCIKASYKNKRGKNNKCNCG